MGLTLAITNSVICMTLILIFGLHPPGVNGGTFCTSTSTFAQTVYCDDDSHCCGSDNTMCCSSHLTIYGNRPNDEKMEAVAAFAVLLVFTCCCVCCYRCCCRRTTNRGFVYSTPGATTAVSVTLPPQQAQQVPYPTIVPYPQQTPYSPQYNPPTNPYYGMPPPAYGVAVQSGVQQASAPSAPYIQS